MPLNCFTLRRLLGLLVMLTPASAFAHARLLRSDPASGSQVSSLAIVRLWFSERPNVTLTSVTLRGEDGATFSVYPPEGASGDPTEVSFRLSAALPPGHYAIAWRTVAMDGHPSQGRFSFTIVGQPVNATVKIGSTAVATSTPATTTTAVQPVSETADNAASVGNSLARAFSFGGILLVIGVVVFNLLVITRCDRIGSDLVASMEARAAVVGVAAGIVTMAAGFVRIFLESRMMHDMPDMGGMAMSVMMLHSLWGIGMQLQIVAAFVAVIAFLISIRRVRFAWLIASVAAAALAFAPALAGHAGASARFQGAMIFTDFLHVAGAASWLGNLTCVMLIGVPIILAAGGDDRWPRISALVNTFSPIALASATLVVISGVLAAAIHLGSVSALWSTNYGRVLVLKLAMVLVTLLIGAYNFRRVQPHLTREHGAAQLRRSATFELGAAAIVIVITGFLTGVAP